MAESTELTGVDAVALRRFLDGENAIVREHVRAAGVHQRPFASFPPEHGGLGRVGAAITAFETLGHAHLVWAVAVAARHSR